MTFETKRIIQKAGWSKKTYDQKICSYNQENNIENLPVGEVTLFAGKYDTYIPYEHTEIMYKKLKEAGIEPLFHSFDYLDHVSIILYLGWLNKSGKDPYQLLETIESSKAA